MGVYRNYQVIGNKLNLNIVSVKLPQDNGSQGDF